jgi:hypothetical protein
MSATSVPVVQILASCADPIKNFAGPPHLNASMKHVEQLKVQLKVAVCAKGTVQCAVIYLVDISECPDFNTMYELYDPCTVMFFFRNKVCSFPCPVP